MKRLQDRHVKNCRVQINKVTCKQIGKIDYLSQMTERRRERNEPSKPYDWQDILKRSKMKGLMNDDKERTFITHLHETKVDNT